MYVYGVNGAIREPTSLGSNGRLDVGGAELWVRELLTLCQSGARMNFACRQRGRDTSTNNLTPTMRQPTGAVLQA